MAPKPKDFKRYYDIFTASISERVDCGRFCAPLNGGTPVCCTTDNAIPIIAKPEWKHLKERTDIWQKFKPFDKTSREIVDELHESCMAVSCKVAPICQRDNRTLACRAFPFYPYFTKDEEIVGLSYYWIFEDRCWVLSNLGCVEQAFIDQMLEVYEDLFTRDEDERQAFVEQSAQARRRFARKDRPLPVISRDGKLMKILPRTRGKLVPAKLKDFARLGAYTSQKAYEAAIRAEGGDVDAAPILKDG